MERVRLLLACVSILLCSFFGALPSYADLVLQPPVPGDVIRGFDPHVTRYGPGHRGVDLSAHAGEPVRAAADGLVTFSGVVAGRPSVSITHHDTTRTTYTPVIGSVRVGQRVTTGEIIGHLDQTPHCEGRHCVHWGLTNGTDYFDPMLRVDERAMIPRLVPLGTMPTLPHVTSGLPAIGPITSPFGMRVHPVTGVYKLHDGVDIGATCGTPLTSVWAGTVTSVRMEVGYGLRVIVDSGDRRSGYAHLQRSTVRVGQRVSAGEVLGEVGNTGYSTGCHVHWMVWDSGRLVDPLTLVRAGPG